VKAPHFLFGLSTKRANRPGRLPFALRLVQKVAANRNYVLLYDQLLLLCE
jgi:hypothetical protein